MRLNAFRIRNFRSIVDTGWQHLSPDNITCLIGQNESGKTSVLEGLRAFYTGTISEDILRSDLSLPDISCRFSIERGWLLKVIDNPGPELRELISGLDQLELTRVWLADFSSVVNVSGEISQYLDSLQDAWKLYIDEVTRKLEKETAVLKGVEKDLNDVIEARGDYERRLSVINKNLKGIKLFRKKEEEAEGINADNIASLTSAITELSSKENELKRTLINHRSLKNAGEKYYELKVKLESIASELNEISLRLEERHQRLTLLIRPSAAEDETLWKKTLDDYRRLRSEREDTESALESHIAYCGNLMDGMSESESASRVAEVIKTYRSQYTSEILGSRYFSYCPIIDLFEDFGSLLPNRIDMDDIISGNENVEGFKAARNFLSIAQLDSSFFQQPSSRILKQKIENLNHTLTNNFQDFWQQSIGGNNKIRIQFELDHYSSAFGDKAGKPYLEFWIKDEGERLYPKQRSRGVRWFLSFYMELKASASSGERPMILLVDEPGVSLHARAQEDVLKVFEDIKERIQVIYTTHSPHLVDIGKLHRVLAVQRDDAGSYRSNTRILDPLGLSLATPDTLTPLQSIMGNPLTAGGFSPGGLNLIVNDTGSFYLLSAALILTGFRGKVNIIPSTGVAAMPLMCNIMLGWSLKFAIILFNNPEESSMEEELKLNMFRTGEREGDIIIRLNSDFANAEDLLSTLDFKTHILKAREGITVRNSEYMKEKSLPRHFLLSRFLSDVKSGSITLRDLDEESSENMKSFTTIVKGLK